MRAEDQQDFSRFISELQQETDRGLALVGAALLDDKLANTLRSFFCEGKSAEALLKEGDAPLGTLSSRIELCFALGLIDEFEYQEINLIRKVRNEFAHSKHGTTFQTEKIRSLCSSLKSPLPEGAGYSTKDPRFRFTNSVVALTLRLYYRPEHVAKDRRIHQKWVPDDFTGWRSVDVEKPPEGVPVVVMIKRGRRNAP
jgi:mannitol operon repressor